MNLRSILKQSDTIVGLARDTRSIVRRIIKIPIHISELVRRNRIIKNYLAFNEIRKLQVGAGPTTLDGWLSTDISPSDHAIFLNAARRFPFDNDIFDYVYSEHMIEHISWHEGLFMLQECQRVLKPGGTIRITTPDLETLIGLYSHNGNPLNERYTKWVTDRFLNGISVYKAPFVINNAFRDFGHQFLYDGELMEMAMREAGFTNIQRYSPGESNNENLRGIESHGKNVADDDMAAFETMVFEAKCPA